MIKPTLVTLALAGLALVPQVRAPKTSAITSENVSARLEDVDKAFQGKRYGRCVALLRELSAFAVEQRMDQIRSVLPTAAGFEVVPDKNAEALKNNPLAQAMSASVGTVVNHVLRQSEGSARIEMTLTLDSPLIGMMNMVFSNPAGVDGELIQYDAHKALLKKSADRLELQILLDGKHLWDVKASRVSEEELFAIVDQKAVDRVAAALAE